MLLELLLVLNYQFICGKVLLLCIKLRKVYAPSKHALDFYLHRGYKVCGNTKTLKYSEIRMEKVL